MLRWVNKHQNLIITIIITLLLFIIVSVITYLIYVYGYYDRIKENNILENFNSYKFNRVYNDLYLNDKEYLTSKNLTSMTDIMFNKKKLENIYDKYYSDTFKYSSEEDFINRYYYGQKSGYEEILAWFKQSQNKSVKYISPKKINNYLIEKGAKSKLLLNNKSNNNNYNHKEDIKRKTNKANFNYLFYNQTFNFDNNKSNNELNVFPTSVENAFNKNKGNIINPIFFGNNNNLLQQNNHIALLTNPSLNNNLNYNNYNNDKGNCFIRNNIFDNNNNINESEDEQMKPNSPLRTNIIQGNLSLKRKKNS